MDYQFRRHYTRDEARALLPQVRKWLRQLSRIRQTLAEQEAGLMELLEPGRDVGGELVNNRVRTMAGLKEVLFEFHRREIQVKDLDRGLVDFPAIMDGKEVFLCWEQGEADIGFWHDLDAGYAGREPL